MRMQAKTNKGYFVNFCLHILGIALCILPPALCTVSYFPLWEKSNEKTICGGVLLLLILCFFPLYKDIKRRLSSVSSYTMWLIIFIIFLLLSRIADEITVISFFGFVGNLLGAICFRLKKRREKNE